MPDAGSQGLPKQKKASPPLTPTSLYFHRQSNKPALETFSLALAKTKPRTEGECVLQCR